MLPGGARSQGQRAVELFDLLNPVRHAASPDGVERYKVEPYVVCADVYGAPPHTGRGGPGTLVPPPGCTGLAWKRYSVSVCGVPGWSSTPASRPAGPVTRSPTGTARPPTMSLSKTQGAPVAGYEV
jgi:glycosyl hydrolase family 36